MRRMRNRILATVLAALFAISGAMPAFAGDTENAESSSVISESSSASEAEEAGEKEGGRAVPEGQGTEEAKTEETKPSQGEGKTEETKAGEKEETTPAGGGIRRSGETAGIHWSEMENGDLVMEDGTVYSPQYPSKDAVAKRQSALEKEPSLLQTKSAPLLRTASGVPSEVPQSFSGTASVVWRDNGADSANFALSGFTGVPSGATSGIGTVYMYCADPSAAAPYEGMVCSYTATFQSWDASTGTATYSLYAIPPGATDGVSMNENGLIGYQRLGGSVSITFKTDGKVHLKKMVSDSSAPMGNGYYTVAGCVYGVYSDKECKQLIETLTTGESGISNTVTLPAGTYYVKETKAGRGLTLDTKVITVTLSSGEDKEITATDGIAKARVGVQKRSANASLTSGNACYSFAGAKYGVYKTRADAEAKRSAIATITVDASGYGETGDVLFVNETYYIRETQGPSNGSYAIDPMIYSVKTKEGYSKADAVVSEETPLNDPTAITIEKVSSTGAPLAAIKPLSGTQFTVKYYAGSYSSLASLPKQETRTWVIEAKKQSDGAYRAYLLPAYKVSGDAFYFLDGNPDPVLPLGTITIEETKAAEGYRLENSYTNGSVKGTGTFLARISERGGLAVLTYGNTAIKEDGFTASDTPIYGGIKIFKMDSDKKKAEAQGDAVLEGAVFEILSNNDYTVTIENKNYKKGDIVKTITTDKKGYAATGSRTLQYGSYTIREKDGKAPTGYLGEGITQRTFTVKEDGVLVDMTSADKAIHNDVMRGGIELFKIDADWMTGTPQGDGSLAGASFAITNESALSVVVGGKEYKKGEVVLTIKTDEKGVAKSEANALPYGSYSVKETDPSAGYRVNSVWMQPFQIREDKQTISLDAVPVPEEVIRGGVAIEKQDAELEKGEALGGADLSGIEFVIKNASKEPVRVEGKDYAPGDAILSIFTDAEGKAATGEEILPYGTYTIQETASDDIGLSANDSYLFTDREERTFQIREDKRIVTADTDGNALVFRDQVKRNDILFRKVEEGTDRSMALIPFCITNVTTGEAHVIVTDSNGRFSSKKYAHSRNTNANDKVLEGLTEETVIKKENLIFKAGVWFGLGRSGGMAPVEDSLPALPYGEYRMDELRCETNEGYELIKGYPIFVDEDVSETEGEPVTLNNLHNIKTVPTIKTKALGDKTGDHTMLAEEKASITDTVSAKNLVSGKRYVLKASLMDVDTAAAIRNGRLAVTGRAEFTATSSNMDIPVPISLNARDLAGRTVVVFEELFLVNEDGSETKLAEHKDVTDTEQQIRIPDLHTTFTDAASGTQIGKPDKEQAVKDTVVYTGLTPGKEITLVATVMTVDEAGNAVPLTDEKGKVFSKAITFKPEEPDGSVDVEFVIDASFLAGKKAVCFEELRYGKIPVAIHADLNDADQTIWYPRARTVAADKNTKDHVAVATADAVFTDTILYSGMKPGESYTAKATLMDADTKKPVMIGGKTVTGEATFIPTSETGEAVVELPVNATAIAGMKTVVYEEVFLQKGGELLKVAEHKDPEDTDQQIVIPELLTSASVDGKKEAVGGKDTRLTDEVSFRGILPGKDYVIKGRLVDKRTGQPLSVDGMPITAQKAFRAKTERGVEEVIFSFDATLLAGKTVVVFEDLYLVTEKGKEIRIASHADVNDEAQSVLIKEPGEPTPTPTPTPMQTPKPSITPTPAKTTIPATPQTGDNSRILWYLVLLGIAASGAVALAIKKKKQKQ